MNFGDVFEVFHKFKPKEWLKWHPWAEFCYNTSWHFVIKKTPFEVVYGRDPQKLLHYVRGTAKIATVERELIARDQALKEVREGILQAQARMKKAYDSHHQEREFSVGDWVFLKLRPYRQMSLVERKNFKLSPRYYGPFKVLDKIGKAAYKLDLSDTSRLHPVFHVSILKKQIVENHKVLRELPVRGDEDSTKLFPQAVLVSRLRKGKNEILIYWCGLSPADATWEEREIIQKHYPDFTLEDRGVN